MQIIACVASVSVKQRAKNGVFGVLLARKMGREQKIGRTGWGRGAKETLEDKPLDFERTELVIGWASQTLLTCVDCLQKALTFLTERAFSRELR